MPKHRAALIILTLLCCIASPGAAQKSRLSGELAQLVNDAGLGGQLGIHVVNLESGEVLYAHNPDESLNPASNMKVLTAATALSVLGADFRMQTGLYGRIDDGRIDSLVLKGYGDPTLEMNDLVELAEDLADRGVRAVGEIVVDGSYFDGTILPPAFDQQPGEMAAFRAAVGAVAVDRASFVLRALPGPTVGSPARIRIAGAGYFNVENGITTTEAGAPNVIAQQSPGSDGRLDLRLRGTIPAGILGVGYRRRVEDPLMHAGHCMAEALERTGIRGRHPVRVASGPSGLPLLATHSSPALSTLLHALGKDSDNFVAEMVLKVLGAERARPGTSENGAKVVQEHLQKIGVKAGAATIVNGSGLFEGNRIAAAHLTHALGDAYRNPAIASEFVAQLAVGGEDGTLHRRLQNLPTKGVVRAKTGTLNAVISLSGYVFGPTRQRTVAFAFLANGIRGKQGAARALADSIVVAIANDLHRNN